MASRNMAAIKGEGYEAGDDCAKVSFLSKTALSCQQQKASGSPDIVRRKYKTVVFVDGCFWHGQKDCKYFRLPKSNVDFWRHKIAMNITRDYANNVDIKLAGWKVIRI